jgi:hypothetical protein
MDLNPQICLFFSLLELLLYHLIYVTLQTDFLNSCGSYGKESPAKFSEAVPITFQQQMAMLHKLMREPR